MPGKCCFKWSEYFSDFKGIMCAHSLYSCKDGERIPELNKLYKVLVGRLPVAEL
jgi:hypothetical protein